MTADQLKQREEVMRNIIVQLMGHTEYMHIKMTANHIKMTVDHLKLKKKR